MKKYVTGGYGNKIQEVEILRESDSCVWLPLSGGRERKALKVTSYEIYHDTWGAALDHLVGRTLQKIKQYEAQLESAKAEMAQLVVLKEKP